MPNQTDLLNIALGNIGARRVSAIDDGTENANQCLTFYPSILEGALRSHHWNFATGRAQLALLPDAPLFDYAYAYALPSDFVKLRQYYDAYVLPSVLTWDYGDFNYTKHLGMFRIETYVPPGSTGPPIKILVSRGTNAHVVYTRRIENPDLWDGQFFWYVAKWLAAELAKAIPKDTKRAAELMQEANYHLLMAAAVDGQEQSVEAFAVPELLWGRW